MSIVINPGTGPLNPDGVSRDKAVTAFRKFKEDLESAGVKSEMGEVSTGDVHGYWTAFFAVDDRQHEVEIPGLPLDKIRCGPNDDPWQFQRIYIDGSSWLWDIAVTVIRDHEPEEDD